MKTTDLFRQSLAEVSAEVKEYVEAAFEKSDQTNQEIVL